MNCVSLYELRAWGCMNFEHDRLPRQGGEKAKRNVRLSR